MAKTDAFDVWLQHANFGDEFAYATDLTYNVQQSKRRKAYKAYKAGLVELFQRKARIAKVNKDGYVWLYEYFAVRVTRDTADKLDFFSLGMGREQHLNEPDIEAIHDE